MTDTDHPRLPAVPTRATPRAVASATATRWTLGALTEFVPANRPGVVFGRGLIAAIMSPYEEAQLRVNEADRKRLDDFLVRARSLVKSGRVR